MFFFNTNSLLNMTYGDIKQHYATLRSAQHRMSGDAVPTESESMSLHYVIKINVIVFTLTEFI